MPCNRLEAGSWYIKRQKNMFYWQKIGVIKAFFYWQKNKNFANLLIDSKLLILEGSVIKILAKKSVFSSFAKTFDKFQNNKRCYKCK